eukprot:jgi/Undpi1/8602/HiC_scaffold_25.g11067.m1
MNMPHTTVAAIGVFGLPHRPSKGNNAAHYSCRGGRRRRPDPPGLPLRGREKGAKTRSNACDGSRGGGDGSGSSSLRVVFEPSLEAETRAARPAPPTHPSQPQNRTRNTTSTTTAGNRRSVQPDMKEDETKREATSCQHGTERDTTSYEDATKREATSCQYGIERDATSGLDGTNQNATSSCVPSSLLAGVRAKGSTSIVKRKGAPGWGCFYPVVLPPEAVRLSAALRDMLEEARSRGRRRRLSEATSVSENAGPAQVLHLASGAQTGLTIISALEDIVVEEGEVFNHCFCEVVRQERKACRQRGKLVEIMRAYYAALIEDVVKHLSRLKLSLEATVSQEMLLKQQAYRVKRLAKLLEEDAKTNEEAQRKLASLELTELERFVASRRETTDAGVDIADAAVGKDDEDNKITGNTDDLDDQDNIDGKRSSSRGSHKSNDSRGGGRGKGENNEGMDAENRRGTESRTAASLYERNGTQEYNESVLILQEMFDQRALLRRVQDRWENWRKHDAATFIRDWWRKHYRAEWEEGDRQYAATLLQAHVRGKLARLLRNRMAEKAAYTRGAAAMQNGFRRYRAVKERKKRARVIDLVLGSDLRSIGQAMSELEAKVSALVEADAQGGRQSRDTATTPRDGSKGGNRSTPGSPSASPSSTPTVEVDENAVATEPTAAGGAVAGAGEKENTNNTNKDNNSVGSLVARLKSMEKKLDQREERRTGGVGVKEGGGHDGRSRRNRPGGGGRVTYSMDGRRIAGSRRHKSHLIGGKGPGE